MNSLGSARLDAFGRGKHKVTESVVDLLSVMSTYDDDAVRTQSLTANKACLCNWDLRAAEKILVL